MDSGGNDSGLGQGNPDPPMTISDSDLFFHVLHDVGKITKESSPVMKVFKANNISTLEDLFCFTKDGLMELDYKTKGSTTPQHMAPGVH
jgi:hypothetical protein